MGDKSAGTSDASPKRKARFAPKIPPRKSRVAALEKSETADEDADIIDSALLRKIKQPREERIKLLKESQMLTVSFGDVDNSMRARSFGRSKGNFDESISLKPDLAALHESEKCSSGAAPYVEDGGNNSDHQVSLSEESDNDNPWGSDSYYPTTLPLRNFENSDEGKLEGASSSSAQNDAEALGFSERSEKPRLLSLQLPAILPMPNSYSGKKGAVSKEGCSLQEFPPGHIGKMLVYKSGKVKMKIGEAVFDVSPGVECSFHQDLMAISTGVDKHCCNLGRLDGRRAVVTPDLSHLLSAQGIGGLDTSSARP